MVSFILYILYFLHLIIPFCIIFLPFLCQKKWILQSIIIFNIFIVTQWYLYGHCILTDIEHYFYPENMIKLKSDKSFITLVLEKNLPLIDEKIIINILSCVPFFSTLVCLYYLDYNYYSDYNY